MLALSPVLNAPFAAVAALPAATQLADEPVEDVTVDLAWRQRPQRRPQGVLMMPSYRVRRVDSTSSVSR
jgi:hypothetical protein